MSALFQSIRWRLQVWHGMILLGVLTAFGFTAYYLARDNRLRRFDEELKNRAMPMVMVLNRFGEPPERRGPKRFDESPNNRGPRNLEDFLKELDAQSVDEPPPDDRKGKPNRPRRNDQNDFLGEQGNDGPPPVDGRRPDNQRGDGPRPQFGNGPHMPPEVRSLFENSDNEGYYYVIWSRELKELKRSTNAPAGIPTPVHSRSLLKGESWTRDGLREQAQASKGGDIVLIGHDISKDLVDLRQLAWLLVLAGGGVLALGLAGGWWLSTKAIAPISDISSTAGKIAEGNLSERINVTETDSELGQLAKVLNDTFARLEATFERQTQFTGDASHELRTPVSVIISQVQTALKRERSTEEYQATLETCQRAAQRMRQLIESLLILARIDSGETGLLREKCNLTSTVTEAVALLSPIAAEREVTLQTDLTDATCRGDANQLAQVVTNLINNAIHYNKPGGTVLVKIAAGPDAVELTVSDSGLGISAEDLPHIFERFYRADKSRSNPQGRTGLGLAIVKGIVDAHQGIITVTSEPGKGSTFTVSLPAN